jgi:flagellum-specific ATP synthase
MLDITGADQQTQAGKVRSWLSTYREAEDLIQIGAYTRGASPTIDEAIARLPAITAFLRQALGEPASIADAAQALAAVVR